MDFQDNLKLYCNTKTCSIAFPASIFDNTPTPHLESYLVGQIARAAVIFNVTEIIIFDEDNNEASDARITRLVKLFEYAECPQYLRKSLFFIEPDLKYAGMINPLEAQHHLRTSQIDCPYREGVTTRQIKRPENDCPATEVNIGLAKPVIVDGHINFNTRVTVKVDPSDLKKMNAMLAATLMSPEAVIVPPTEPMQKLNLFWGYYVRRANSLSEVVSKNIFDPTKKKFYDLIIGTSEHGTSIDELIFNSNQIDTDKPTKKKRKHETPHTLIVFGGVKGLEHSASCDPELKDFEVSKLFHHYINTCPNQGSNTIRTEEAVLITLSSLRPKLK